jgi:hypothetical protein
VQSHVQKYFIKLAKAGLPIPGRMPNLKTYKTKKGTRGRSRKGGVIGRKLCNSNESGPLGAGTSSTHHRRVVVGRGVSLNEISSMWTSFNPPISMDDANNSNNNNNDDDEYSPSEDNDFEDDEEEELTSDQFENVS